VGLNLLLFLYYNAPYISAKSGIDLAQSAIESIVIPELNFWACLRIILFFP